MYSPASAPRAERDVERRRAKDTSMSEVAPVAEIHAYERVITSYSIHYTKLYD